MLLIGLMSGTSADGIDAALVEITGEGRGTRLRLVDFVCVPHTEEMRSAILEQCRPDAPTADLCALNFALGEAFAEAARAVAEKAGVALAEVEAVCSHGQTVWHQPSAVDAGGRTTTATLQIGEPAVIAARTGRQVVSGFRTADMALGGQGAPLVPYADWALFTSDDEARAVLNIGGIANVTHLPRSARLEEVIAFDTGPGNMLIDTMAGSYFKGIRFDDGGKLAGQGTVDHSMVDWLMENDYFAAPPPKSTGRELFGEEFAYLLRDLRKLKGRDMLATMCAFTARSIGQAFRDFLEPRGGVQTVVVGGGGSHNKTLMRMLAEELPGARITTHAEFGLPDDAKEAAAFALLGYETLHGRPSNVPSATGARRPAVLGSVTPA